MSKLILFYSIVIAFFIALAPSCPNEKKADYYFNEGKREIERKNFEEAIKYFNCAIKMNPDCLEVYIDRANAKMKIYNSDSAIKDYDLAYKIETLTSNQRAEISYLKALAYRDKKDTATACIHFQNACIIGSANRYCEIYKENCEK